MSRFNVLIKSGDLRYVTANSEACKWHLKSIFHVRRCLQEEIVWMMRRSFFKACTFPNANSQRKHRSNDFILPLSISIKCFLFRYFGVASLSVAPPCWNTEINSALWLFLVFTSTCEFWIFVLLGFARVFGLLFLGCSPVRFLCTASSILYVM